MIGKAIAAVAGALGNSIGWLAEHGVLFAVFAFLWIALAVGLVVSEGSVDQAWQAIGALPLLVQLILWLLFLPLMAGLWVWQTDWPFVVRLLLVVGLAGWNLLVLVPRRASQAPAQ